MAEAMVVPEHAEFIRSLMQLARRGDIAWETTADADVIIAALDAGYSVRLETVPDLQNADSEPDHQVSLLKGRRLLFTLDRLSFDSTAPFQALYPGKAF